MLRPTNEFGGSGLCGYIDVTYARLVEVFGEPNSEGDGYKVDAEWDLKDDVTGAFVTIYNYKDGYNYLGRPPERAPVKAEVTAGGEYAGLHESDAFSNDHGMAVEDITDWHVDGKGREAMALVEKALGIKGRPWPGA